MFTEVTMDGCTHVFHSWCEVIKEKRSNQEKVENIEKMINMGLRLSKLTKMANRCLSPFLLLHAACTDLLVIKE